MYYLLTFFIFFIFIIIQFTSRLARKRVLSRNFSSWIIDIIGLFVQGIIIPLTSILLCLLMNYIYPNLHKSIEISFIVQFLISFVLIDYIYYWNHRLFHKAKAWFLHRIHHSSEDLDIFSTSRNSIITSFFIVYLWSQALGLFLLENPSGFICGFILTFALDLWRHSRINLPQKFSQFIEKVIITPNLHTLHHSRNNKDINFGANFSIWDRLHNTIDVRYKNPNVLGEELPANLKDILLFPWRLSK